MVNMVSFYSAAAIGLGLAIHSLQAVASLQASLLGITCF